MFNSPGPSPLPQHKLCPTCGREEHLGAAVCPYGGVDGNRLFENEPQFAGKYKFLGVIGSGGMGVIYKALMLAVGKQIAVKMMHEHLLTPDAVARFKVEARATGMLSHPYIVRIHDFGTTSTGQPFMVMDFVSGKTLADILKNEGALSSRRFIRIFSQVCDALSHAHKRNVLHRDIKPSNIMVVRNDDNEEEVRIMDFGVAKVTGDAEANQLTKTGEAVGSPLYMSPEQSRGKPDARSDLYSLGCVMYEALTLSPPFEGTSALDTMLLHLNEPPQPMQKVAPDNMIDTRLEAIVQRLLEKDPADRYQTMDELRDELDATQAPPLVTRKLPSTTKTRASGLDNTTKLLIGAALGGIAIIGGASYFILQDVKPVKKVPITAPIANSVSTVNTFLKYDPAESLSIALKNKTDPLDISREFKALEITGQVSKKDIAALATPAADYVRDLSFRHMGIDDQMLETITHLNLRRLDLERTNVEDLHAIKDMNSLQILNVQEDNIGQDALNVITGLSNLENLRLSRTAYTGKQLKELSKLHNLMSLDITGCQKLTDTDIADLQDRLPRTLIGYVISDNGFNETEKRLLAKMQVEISKWEMPAAGQTLIRLLQELELNKHGSDVTRMLLNHHIALVLLETKSPRADEYFVAAYNIAKKRYSGHLIEAKYALDIASSKIAQKKFAEAESLIYRASAIIDSVLASNPGADVATVATIMQGDALKILADSLANQDLFDRSGKAEAAYRKCLQVLEKNPTANRLALADAELGLGNVLARKRQTAAARSYVQKADDMYAEIQKLHWEQRAGRVKIQDLLVRRAITADLLGNLPRSIELRKKLMTSFARAIEKKEFVSDKTSDEVIGAHANVLIQQQLKFDKTDAKGEARQTCDQWLALLEKVGHENSVGAGDAHMQKGYIFLQNNGTHTQALAEFQQAIQFYKQNLRGKELQDRLAPANWAAGITYYHMRQWNDSAPFVELALHAKFSDQQKALMYRVLKEDYEHLGRTADAQKIQQILAQFKTQSPKGK